MNVPSTVIIQQLRAEILSELRLDIQRLQNAINALKGIADASVPHSAAVEDWQQALAAAHQRKAAAKDEINDSLSLTGEEKAEMMKKWKLWHKAVAGYIGAIIGTLQKWPAAKWKWDEQGQNIVPSRPTCDIADEMATRPVPPAAQEHGKLLGAVYQAIADLRRWERHNNVRKIPIEPLLKTPAESLGEQWVNGSILRQTGLDTTTLARVNVFESTFI